MSLKRPLRGSVAAALAVVAVLFELTHDGFRIDALTAVVVGQSSLDGLLGQNRAVHLDGRQTFQSLDNGLVGQLQGLVNGLALDESVAMLLVAIAAPQPKVRNLTSTMTLSRS